MAMDYFRRPALVGKNLKRLPYALVRAARRRLNPDGVSAEPYYADLSVGDTLVFDTQAGTITVTFTGRTYATVLADITAAIAAQEAGAAKALDLDGAIGIQSNTPGWSGFIRITGGTGAEKLGFDGNLGALLYARGGDLNSAAEGRIGNPHGAVLLGDENLTSDSVNRIAGRLAANLDVLFADVAKNQAVLKPVRGNDGNVAVFDASTPVNASFDVIVPPASAMLFTGKGILDRSSSKELLACYFMLVDRVTKLPAASRVVGMTKGTPAANATLPRPNTASWAANDGGNLLGQDLVKVSAAITKVHDGRTVECAGANFAGVSVGDVAEISGATNLSPWTNNGYRWVVEKVVSSTKLHLRPMSQAEADQLGVVVDDSQPVLELNDSITGGEGWGTLNIRSGTFASGVTLLVSPPIPTGSQYELWAAQPVSLRGATSYDVREAASPAYRAQASDLDPVPNALLRPPILAGPDGNGDVTVTAGYLRWHGRPIYLASRTIPRADFAANSTSYVYVDDVTASLKISTDPAAFGLWDEGTTGTKKTSAGHLVGVVVRGAANITSVKNTGRSAAESVRQITVGQGGQFLRLEDALAHVEAWALSDLETTGPTGMFPHYDIVLVSDTSTNGYDLSLVPVALRITGAVPGVTVQANGGFITIGTGGSLVLEDFVVDGQVTSVVELYGEQDGVDRVVFNRMTVRGAYRLVGGIGSVRHIQVFDTVSNTNDGLVKVDFDSLDLERSTFAGGAITEAIISDGNPEMGVDSVSIRGCTFTGWTHPGNFEFLAKAGGLSRISVRESVFDYTVSASPGVFLTVGDTASLEFADNKVVPLVQIVASGVVRDNVLGASYLGGGKLSVESNTSTGAITIQATESVVLGNKFASVDIYGKATVVGNRCSGQMRIGTLTARSGECVVGDNYVAGAFSWYFPVAAQPAHGFSGNVFKGTATIDGIGDLDGTGNYFNSTVSIGVGSGYLTLGNSIFYSAVTVTGTGSAMFTGCRFLSTLTTSIGVSLAACHVGTANLTGAYRISGSSLGTLNAASSSYLVENEVVGCRIVTAQIGTDSAPEVGVLNFVGNRIDSSFTLRTGGGYELGTVVSDNVFNGVTSLKATTNRRYLVFSDNIATSNDTGITVWSPIEILDFYRVEFADNLWNATVTISHSGSGRSCQVHGGSCTTLTVSGGYSEVDIADFTALLNVSGATAGRFSALKVPGEFLLSAPEGAGSFVFSGMMVEGKASFGSQGIIQVNGCHFADRVMFGDYDDPTNRDRQFWGRVLFSNNVCLKDVRICCAGETMPDDSAKPYGGLRGHVIAGNQISTVDNKYGLYIYSAQQLVVKGNSITADEALVLSTIGGSLPGCIYATVSENIIAQVTPDNEDIPVFFNDGCRYINFTGNTVIRTTDKKAHVVSYGKSCIWGLNILAGTPVSYLPPRVNDGIEDYNGIPNTTDANKSNETSRYVPNLIAYASVRVNPPWPDDHAPIPDTTREQGGLIIATQQARDSVGG